MQKKSKIIIISVVTAILLIVGVMTAISLTGAWNNTEKVTTEKLSLGQKFLLDLEYDKAVAEFQAVIDIEPKNVDAYIGLADAYIGLGDKEKAKEILEKGISETDDQKLKDKLSELLAENEPEETTVAETTTPEETITSEETTTVAETTTPEETTTPPETTPEETTTPPETTTETTVVETTTVPEATAPTSEPKDREVAYTERKVYGDGSYEIEEYDSNGYQIKQSYYNADGTLREYYAYEFDSNGKLIKNSHYNSAGMLCCYYIYEYDSNGNYINRIRYNADGNYISQTRTPI